MDRILIHSITKSQTSVATPNQSNANDSRFVRALHSEHPKYYPRMPSIYCTDPLMHGPDWYSSVQWQVSMRAEILNVSASQQVSFQELPHWMTAFTDIADSQTVIVVVTNKRDLEEERKWLSMK
jgi:hypothetical protein